MKNIDVASSANVVEGEIFATKVEGLSVLLTRVKGKAYAVENKCAHLGLSMEWGKLTGSTLQCPWHGSKFDVCTGKNIDWVSGVVGVPMPGWTHKIIALGKEPAPIRSFATSEKSGRVLISVDA
jgi:nitrite reductase/ring-hydroxylating ferredoxin subunit